MAGCKMTFLAQLWLSRKFYTSYIAFTAIISVTVWLILVSAEQRSRLVREHFNINFKASPCKDTAALSLKG